MTRANNLFPVLNEAIHVSWDMVELHNGQALRNHSQTIERLAERGGLGWGELIAVLEDRPYGRIDKAAAREQVIEHQRKWQTRFALPPEKVAEVWTACGGKCFVHDKYPDQPPQYVLFSPEQLMAFASAIRKA